MAEQEQDLSINQCWRRCGDETRAAGVLFLQWAKCFYPAKIIIKINNREYLIQAVAGGARLYRELVCSYVCLCKCARVAGGLAGWKGEELIQLVETDVGWDVVVGKPLMEM